jgi:hypothetical protein
MRPTGRRGGEGWPIRPWPAFGRASRASARLPIPVEVLLPTSESSQPKPGRTITALDDALTRTIGRLSLNLALFLAALAYVGIGLALPLGVGARAPLLIACNVIGVSFGWAITLAWVFRSVQSTHRRHLLEWTTNLRLLSAQEFEWLVGEMLRREGWQVEETAREGEPDGNVDLRIHRGERRALVQCKRWTSTPVGVEKVRELAGTLVRELTGTLVREGLPADAGILVTLSHFTAPAVAEAAKLRVQLVDNRDLVRRIEDVRATEPCPVCSTPMIPDRSTHGWWLRCPRYFDGCKGKRNLAEDPARALELMLAPD